jgi:hypothetical protein
VVRAVAEVGALMPIEHVLLVPRLFVVANRLHRASGRPVYAGRVCLALVAAAGLFAVGFALTGLIDMEPGSQT